MPMPMPMPMPPPLLLLFSPFSKAVAARLSDAPPHFFSTIRCAVPSKEVKNYGQTKLPR